MKQPSAKTSAPLVTINTALTPNQKTWKHSAWITGDLLSEATSTQKDNEIFFRVSKKKNQHKHDNRSIKYAINMGMQRSQNDVIHMLHLHVVL